MLHISGKEAFQRVKVLLWPWAPVLWLKDCMKRRADGARKTSLVVLSPSPLSIRRAHVRLRTEEVVFAFPIIFLEMLEAELPLSFRLLWRLIRYGEGQWEYGHWCGRSQQLPPGIVVVPRR